MQTKDLIQLIDRTLVDIWKNEIKSDYECGWLLKEDTLKNALYFHLRSKLGTVFEYNDVRIFTEFTDCKFKGTGCRPDMVIARVDMNAPSKYWGNNVTECLAVIEIKYKAGFTPHHDIIADYEKLKHYVQELGVTAKLYMATVWEYEDEPSNWECKNAAWAKDRLTELMLPMPGRARVRCGFMCGSINEMLPVSSCVVFFKEFHIIEILGAIWGFFADI